MNAATWPRPSRAHARLLRLDRARGTLADRSASDLPELLSPGDLLVVNDAATLPASLSGHADGVPFELRLMDEEAGLWRAVAFGAGSWRTPTERRAPPPRLAVGARLSFGGPSARVEAVLPPSPRLLAVRFDQSAEALWTELYRVGKPVQYAYLSGELRLWHVQNAYAARPWAAEAPSAGFVLSGALITRLRQRGIELTTLTHAAGLSSTGDAALDAALPLSERFDIPEACCLAIERARSRGGRVVAVGTSVVRALETRALEGVGVRPGAGRSALRIGPGFPLRVVQGLLSGMHDPGASHHALLQAFAPSQQLDEARAAAERWGYLEHEFGDVCLLL